MRVCFKIKDMNIGIQDFTILQVILIGWLIKLCRHPSTIGVTIKIKKKKMDTLKIVVITIKFLQGGFTVE